MRLHNVLSSALLSARRRAWLALIVPRRYARPLQRHASRVWRRYGAILGASVFLLAIFTSFYLAHFVQAFLEPYFSGNQEIESLRAVVLNVGSALMGAAAIVTSLVLFAMQVNIGRMPHGLFRRLSADARLLWAFTAAFVCAAGVATLSTFIGDIDIGHIVLGVLWGVVLIFTLFRYAYGRALYLVSPLNQLDSIFWVTNRNLRRWSKGAQRATLLFDDEPTPATDTLPASTTHNNVRTTYFDLDTRGSEAATKGVQHAMSFARRYGEQGDYEISGAALNTVVRINAAYIKAKEKTFYASTLVYQHPRSTDSFINEVLEALRQSVQIGIMRRDEQYLEQTLHSMAALAQLYLGIVYANPDAEKTHANLAAGYLANAVQGIIPHAMIDVLLTGERLIGRTAESFLHHGNAADIVPLSNDLSVIASAGTKGEDYRPLTTVGMEQFANLTFHLLIGKSPNMRSLANRISGDVTRVATTLLSVADAGVPSVHRTCLEPYFSLTSTDGLRIRLASLGNFLCQQPEGNAATQRIIRHVERWADGGLYQTTRQVCLASMSMKSHFTFDMIQWIRDVMEILLAVSNAPACRPGDRTNLRNHAHRLIAIFNLIPSDRDTVTFVENWELSETLFEAAMTARKHGCQELSSRIGQYLLSWTFKAGKNETGGGTLELGLCAYAVLSLNDSPGGTDAIKSAIRARVQGEEAPSPAVLADAARGIRTQASNIGDHVDTISKIESALSEGDPGVLIPLLHEIADICAGAQ